MPPTLASAIDPLLLARSVAHRPLARPAATSPRLQVHAPCRIGEGAAVDVLVLELERWQAGRVAELRGALAAQSVVAVGPPPRAHLTKDAERDPALLLSREGWLSAPGFAIGSPAPERAPAGRCRADSGVVLIAQDHALALLHYELLARRGIGCSLLVSTGAPQPIYWRSWLHAATRSNRVHAVLLALSSPPAPELLAKLTLPPVPPVVLHVSSDRRSAAPPPGAGHPDRPPDGADVARALGWIVADSLECAADATALLGQGLRPGGGRVAALGESALHHQVVIQSLHQAGLPAHACTTGSADRVSAVVSAGSVELGPLADLPHLTLTETKDQSRGTEQPSATAKIAASGGTLRALSAMLRAEPSTTASPPPTAQLRQAASEARRLLATCPASLDELQVKALLAPFDISAPTERLTTSASAAADAARSIGTPVALKAIGPALRSRSSWGGIELPVQSVSAARQAFRDILHAARQQRADTPLTGILVSQLVDLPVTLDCAIHVLGQLQLLQLQVRCGAAYLGRRQSQRCPLNEAAAADLAEVLFAEAGRALAPWHPPRKSTRQALATFLLRLSAAGQSLAQDLRWIRLDTVALPTTTRPALVVDAAAERLPSR